MKQVLEEIPSMALGDFLQVSLDLPYSETLPDKCFKKPFLLPEATALLEEERFADVAMCYHHQGLCLAINVHQAFQDVAFPEVSQGDSIEIFLDTRDVKSAGSLHKFCHHFVFLPKEVQGINACEVTRLRAEDSHPLCDPAALHVTTIFEKNSYESRIVIDHEALYGFDPRNFQRLGFSYRINRKNLPSQHLNCSSERYVIERYPALWASLKLNPLTS